MKRAKRISLVGIIGLSVIFMAGSALGAADTASLNVNATVNARAKLTLGVAAINFADADPDSTPSIANSEGAVSVAVKVRTGSASTATLTHLAAGDLASGGDTIGIGNVTWTATGSGYQAGTMNKSSGQTAGSWTGSGQRNGTFSYALANSWSYASGSYAVSSTYTLTAP